MVNINSNIKKYLKESPKLDRINWYELPDSIHLKLRILPEKIKKLGEYITVKRLKLKQFQNSININPLIIKIKGTSNNIGFNINFPVNLNNIYYVKLYSLMVSEGYSKTEFTLNVPEEFFHNIFRKNITKLISAEATKLIKIDYNKGFPRSRAPAILRYLIPIPKHIPAIIFNNKEFAREYLRIAFEAEGSPILNKKQHKRYIKLSRYTDISSFISEENIPLGKRIYINKIKEEYLLLFDKIKNNPPKILLGEQLMLKKHFNIDAQLSLEAIRKNYTPFRAGKISARWVLFIYANNIDKFIQEIGFISHRKNKLIDEMKKIRAQNPKYYTLKIIEEITDRMGRFYRKDFNRVMISVGYKSPSCYLLRYERNKIIRRIKRGYYILSSKEMSAIS